MHRLAAEEEVQIKRNYASSLFAEAEGAQTSLPETTMAQTKLTNLRC